MKCCGVDGRWLWRWVRSLGPHFDSTGVRFLIVPFGTQSGRFAPLQDFRVERMPVIEKVVTVATERVHVNLSDKISIKHTLDEEARQYFADLGYKEDYS